MSQRQITKDRDWIKAVSQRFKHPAIVLWRAVELRQIEEELKKVEVKEPVLDLGCAEGNISEMLLQGRRIIGLDNCWGLLSKNKSSIYQGLILADARAMPFKDSSFPSVFSNCVIEHIPDLEFVLSEISRVLEAKGILVFTVPSHKFGDYLFFTALFQRIGLASLAKWYRNKRNKLLDHFHCYSHNAWKEILEKKGLALTAHRYYLSEKTMIFWDIAAAIVLCAKYIPLLRLFFPAINRRLEKYFSLEQNSDIDIGGALLLIAQK